MSNKEGPPLRRTARHWARAATKVTGGDLSTFGKTKSEVHLRRVWAGIVKENCPELGLKEIVKLGGLNVAHSTVHALYEGWKKFPWRQRHGWLMMAEVAVSSGPDWTPAAWHQELHELSLMALGEKVKPTPWHNPVARMRRPIIGGGGSGKFG